MVLTGAEQRFVNEQHHGRLATVTRCGAPQVKPVGFSYDEALGTIDIAGMNMAASAKYKNVPANPQVAFAADDVPASEKGAGGVRFLEIRGTAETATADEPDAAGHLALEIIRIHPRRILAFNVDGPGLRVRDADGATVASERWPA